MTCPRCHSKDVCKDEYYSARLDREMWICLQCGKHFSLSQKVEAMPKPKLPTRRPRGAPKPIKHRLIFLSCPQCSADMGLSLGWWRCPKCDCAIEDTPIVFAEKK